MGSESLTVYDLVPDRVVADRYRIVGPHRQGGLSTALEVVDSESDEHCELQLFPSALFESDRQAQGFFAAWEPWKRVSSDAVLRVRDVLRIGPTTMVLITDFPEGDSLRTRLNSRKRLEREEVLRIGIQLLSGLVEIHEHGLVHGDIKPYTIHVQGNGSGIRAMLVDGGVTPGLWTAKDLGEKTALIGTPYYAPVELFGGDSPDVQSDVYNVATVLFEAVTGALPWAGRSFLEIFQAKLEKRPPSMKERAPDAGVDPELEAAIVTGCLADRSERYATAREFRERFESLLQA